MNQFSTDLDKNKANYVALSPLSFITRAKDIYPNYESVSVWKKKLYMASNI